MQINIFQFKYLQKLKKYQKILNYKNHQNKGFPPGLPFLYLRRFMTIILLKISSSLS